MIVAANHVDEVVGAQVPFLPQEDVDDLLSFARALAPERFEARQVWQGRRHGRTRQGSQSGGDP